uniref:hypothetical protein n=1 Tax=Shewanella algae TaxID=38313 RepID=UPI001F393E31
RALESGYMCVATLSERDLPVLASERCPYKLFNRHHIEIDANGNPKINRTTLNVSIGDLEHAEYFQSLRPGSEITSFEIPKWMDDFIQSEAIP